MGACLGAWDLVSRGPTRARKRKLTITLRAVKRAEARDLSPKPAGQGDNSSGCVFAPAHFSSPCPLTVKPSTYTNTAAQNSTNAVRTGSRQRITSSKSRRLSSPRTSSNPLPAHRPSPLPKSIPHVDEIGVTSAPLKSASFFIGEHCKTFNGPPFLPRSD